jgi:hypothetical protein
MQAVNQIEYHGHSFIIDRKIAMEIIDHLDARAIGVVESHIRTATGR